MLSFSCASSSQLHAHVTAHTTASRDQPVVSDETDHLLLSMSSTLSPIAVYPEQQFTAPFSFSNGIGIQDPVYVMLVEIRGAARFRAFMGRLSIKRPCLGNRFGPKHKAILLKPGTACPDASTAPLHWVHDPKVPRCPPSSSHSTFACSRAHAKHILLNTQLGTSDPHLCNWGCQVVKVENRPGCISELAPDILVSDASYRAEYAYGTPTSPSSRSSYSSFTIFPASNTPSLRTVPCSKGGSIPAADPANPNHYDPVNTPLGNTLSPFSTFRRLFRPLPTFNSDRDTRANARRQVFSHPVDVRSSTLLTQTYKDARHYSL